MTSDHAEAIASLPDELRRLVEDELAAGNEVVDAGHSFPAPPVGCYVMLARPVSTRPRTATAAVGFHERSSSLWSGEFFDAKRWHFVLEPPLTEPVMPDMDAIREAAGTRSHPGPVPAEAESLPDRFRDSMSLNVERWREGTGYDLDAIRQATREERDDIERLLIGRGVLSWRDVEALAELGTPAAREALLAAMRSGDLETRLDIVAYAPHLIGENEREACVVEAIENADGLDSLSKLLLLVERIRTPAVIGALLRGTLRHGGETAVHFAAILTWLHGRAGSPFDWEQRPFFLRFHTENPDERHHAYLELCERLGIDPETPVGVPRA